MLPLKCRVCPQMTHHLQPSCPQPDMPEQLPVQQLEYMAATVEHAQQQM